MVGARIPCMATVFDEPEAHPVAALVARFHADLDELGDPRLWSMSQTELADTLASVAALRHRLTELELRVATQADHLDLGANHGATDTASWWANTTRQTERDAKRRLDLATRWTTTTNRSGTRWPPDRCPRSRRW